MVITRIRRGAVRTHVLIKNKLYSALNRRPVQVTANRSLIRTIAFGMLTTRIAFAFVPVAVAAEAPHTTDADVPPSISAVVDFVPTTAEALQAVNPELTDVTVGKSLATVADEAEAARQAEEEQKRQEAAKERRQQIARYLEQEKQALMAAVSTDGSDVASKVYQAAVSTFGEAEAAALMRIVSWESGFNPSAYNHSSGACGLFQALPCSKMGGMEVDHQIAWGINYIKARYGTPSNALAFWLTHHWY